MNKTLKKQHLILHDKNIIKGILILAIPVMLNNVVKALHDIVDTFLVSQMEGPTEIISAQISAIGFVSPIINICQALAIGMMTAGVALMSQYIGAGKEDKARKVSGQLLLLCTIVGIIFNIVLYFLSPAILTLMNAEGELFNYSLTYIRLRSFELTGLFIFYSYQATRHSQGDTVNPVIINVISVVLNIILTTIFIYGMKMDITGAALGTVIANVIIIFPCVIHMIKSSTLTLKLDGLTPNFEYISKIIKFGMPAAISQAFTSFGFLIINGVTSDLQNSLGAVGYSILAPVSIGGRINSILLLPVMGIGTVLATFVGQNVGAGNKERASKAFLSSIALSLMLTIAGGFIIFPFRELIIRIFLSNPNEIDICMLYMNYLIFGLPLMGLFQCFIGCFQGAGRTDLVLILSTVRLWLLRIPVLLAMVYLLDFDYQAVWLCMVISNFGATILGLLLYQRVDYEPRISNIHRKIRQELKA